MKQYHILMLVIIALVPTAVFAGTGPHHFLWKPTSENDHKLCLLFPNSFRKENVQKIEVITANGTETPHTVFQREVNGDRIHASFDKPGSQYPAPATVKMTMKDGSARTWQVNDTSNRMEAISTGTPADGSSGGGEGYSSDGGLDSVLGGGTGSAVSDDTYVFDKDGTINIEACLLTYGQASLRVDIVVNGREENFMSWSRSGDSDASLLKVQGREILDSNKEVKPGDWTPQKVSIPLEGRRGDKVILNLEGSFGAASPILKINGDGIVSKEG